MTKEPATYENAVENCQSLGGNLLHFDHVDLQTTFFTKYEVNHTTNTNTSLWVKNWTEGDAALQWTTKGQPNKTQCMAFEHTDKMGFAAESCETKFKSLCDLSLPSLPTKNITLPSLNIPSSIGGFFTTLSTLLSNNSEIVIETKITNEGEPVSMWCKLLFRLFC